MAKEGTKSNAFAFKMTEKTLQKWTIIQLAAFLPLVLSVAFLIKFRGSILGTITFFSYSHCWYYSASNIQRSYTVPPPTSKRDK